MSRVGKVPVELPAGVQVSIADGTLTCKGPKGSLKMPVHAGVTVAIESGKVVIGRVDDTKLSRAMHGTSRALLQNMVNGVTKGFSRQLEIVGVGYKASVQGKKINLNVGFANTIEVAIPEGVKVEVPDATHINVSGLDKHLVGQVAADIRSARKPEPYKGKGIRYANEQVRRKPGKAAAGSAGAKA